MTCSCPSKKATKIFRCTQIIENDLLDPQAMISLELTIKYAKGWKLHSIEHAGTKSNKSEVHRYLLVFSKEVTINGAIDYIFNDIFEEDSSSFIGKPIEEIVDYIDDKYEQKKKENWSEIDDSKTVDNLLTNNGSRRE